MSGARLGGPFWRLFASSATSNLADGIGRVAFPLLAASITRDPVVISGLAALLFLPWLLFALPSGTLVDRVNRRTAMSIANGVRAVTVGAVGVAVALDAINIPILYIAAFAIGVAETVYDSAARAILTQVVGRDQLDRGNGLLMIEENVGQIFLGAPLGSWLFAALAAAPFLTNAAGFAIAAMLVLSLRGNFKHERTTHTTVGADMREGLRWLWNSDLMRRLTAVSGVTSLLGAAVNALFVLYALEVLRMSNATIGLLLIAGGIGGLAGGLLAPWLGQRIGRSAALVLSSLLCPLAMGGCGLTTNAWIAGVLFALAAGFSTIWNVLSMSLRQALIPPELFGRVQGAYRTIIWGGIPLGSVLGGLLASATTISTVFVASGIAQCVVAYWVWRMVSTNRQVIAAAYAEDESPQSQPAPTAASKQ